MKKFLYIMPAVLVCMLYMLLATLAGGISEFQPIAFLYVLFPIATGILLRKGKWWGGLFGVAMGILVVYNSMTAENTLKATLIFGFAFVGYYALMSVLCAVGHKKNNSAFTTQKGGGVWLSHLHFLTS